MQIRNSNISPFLVRDYPEPEMGCLRFGSFSRDSEINPAITGAIK